MADFQLYSVPTNSFIRLQRDDEQSLKEQKRLSSIYKCAPTIRSTRYSTFSVLSRTVHHPFEA